ncbi:MAG: hypothetical protein GPI91_04595 [Microcystis aeruginosa K13-10]|nr:hypothetical protein [Microcystis aeruginosa K13-10]
MILTFPYIYLLSNLNSGKSPFPHFPTTPLPHHPTSPPPHFPTTPLPQKKFFQG